MKITHLGDVQPKDGRSVAVGTFDGVHVGHREVIAGSDTVLTFDPHPVAVVAPQHTPKLLTPLWRKAELIASLGVQELIVIGFDAGFAMRSADEFVEDVLVERIGATRVSIGENFRFGHKAQGDPRLLAADGRFTTVVHPLLRWTGRSSPPATSGAWCLPVRWPGRQTSWACRFNSAARWFTGTSVAVSSASRPPT